MNNILEHKRADVVTLAQRRQRLLNAKSSRHPMLKHLDEPEQQGVYGVSTEGDDCVISLGPVAPFRIPKSIAIKLAMLILRRCGVEVVDG